MNMKQAAAAVAAKLEFKAKPCFAEQGSIYVVYSYGYHYPMFIYEHGQWYENGDRYSVTTERQKRVLRPVKDTIKVSTRAMKQILESHNEI